MGNIWSYLPYKVPETWREPDDIFSQKEKDRILDEIDALVPPKQCQSINIVVIGYIGSGKSSLVNTFKTVLRNSGQLSTIAATYELDHGTMTTKLFEVTLKRFPQGEKLRIFDCRGVVRRPFNTVPKEDDLMKVIYGHIKQGYEFKETAIREDDDSYRRNPTLSEKMHCVLFVINADTQIGEYDELKRVQHRLQTMNIPIRVILTRADRLCQSGNLNSIFRSEKAYNKVDEVKRIFRFQDCQILPVANYVRGTTQNMTQDVLALLALNNTVQEAMSYIENEM